MASLSRSTQSNSNNTSVAMKIISYGLCCWVLLSSGWTSTSNVVVVGVNASTATASPSPSRKSLQFFGASTGSIHIDRPKGVSSSSLQEASLEEWIASPHCIPSILGKGNLTVLPESGLVENRQPKVAFFGLEIIPVYFHSIERPTSNEIKVDIVRTQTLVESKNRFNEAAANVMEKSVFEGGSHVRIVSDETGWTVTFDISFGVSVPLPSYFWVPPGFSSLWRGVIGGACQKKAESLLEELKKSYEEWANQQIDRLMKDDENRLQFAGATKSSTTTTTRSKQLAM